MANKAHRVVAGSSSLAACRPLLTLLLAVALAGVPGLAQSAESSAQSGGANADLAANPGAGPGPRQPSPLRLAAPLLGGGSTAAVTPDGDLSEWLGREPDLRLNQAEQVWSAVSGSKPWGGAADLSADIWLGYDLSHIYVAGRVRDDSFVGGGPTQPWHQQDAVEVFLDLRPDRSAADADALVQLFVMPFSAERRWGRIDQTQGRPITAGLTGTRVGTKRGDGEYGFELVIPLCNFPEFVQGQTEAIGFDLAIDDHDEGTDRYQYVTATGANPVESVRLNAELEFGGGLLPGAPISAESGLDVVEWFSANAANVLVPLLGLGVLLLLLRGWGAVEKGAPRLRMIGRVAGVALFVFGLMLPSWLVGGRRGNSELELRRVVTLLEDKVEVMEQSVLGSYGGEQRDQAFATLLRGGAIARDKQYSYTGLRQVLGAAAKAPRPIELMFSVLPYGIPLRPESVHRFEFRQPLPPGTLNVAIARPVSPWPQFDDRDPPSLQLTIAGLDDAVAPKVDRLVCSGSYFPVHEVARPGLEVSYRSIALDGPVRRVSISEPQGEGLELVGLTWVSPDKTEERPLPLGEPSLGGIETDLRGRYPLDAGFELAPGQNHTITIKPSPENAKFDKLWLFYRARYLGRPTGARVGDTVCELRLQERGKREARLLEFSHQESMFFELELQNQDVPRAEDVRVAMRWSDEEQEARINLVRELDLGAAPAKLEFRNVGPYPIRFRSIVFGREVSSIAVSQEGSPLRRTGSGNEEELTPEFRAALGAVDVALYRGGRLTASTLSREASSGYTTLPADVRPAALTEGMQLRAVESEANGLEQRAFTVLGGDWGGAVLGVFLRDTGYRDYSENVHRIGTCMSLFSVPILLHILSGLLAILGSLRLRLVGYFAIVMLVPLGLLTVVLMRVLETGHEGDMRRRLGQAVATANEGLVREQAALRAAAESWVVDLADQYRGENARAPEIRNRVLSVMRSQMPPGWQGDGGFLQFEFTPTPTVAGLPAPTSLFVGAEELGARSTPLRTEPGLYVSGVPFIGVRAELPVDVGVCSLSVGRRVDSQFLSTLAGERGVVLCGVNGYPLDVAGGGGLDADAVLRHGKAPDAIAARSAIAARVLDRGLPVTEQHEVEGGDTWVAIYDVLRDLQETPRALLGIVERYSGARLPLNMGRVPATAFFLSMAALLIAASLFLGWVMTNRISQPIERLEKGARALSRGELDVRVEAQEGGQIGRLTSAFNAMAGDLRGRIEDLHVLNHGIRDLTAKLELGDVLTSAITFYARHTPADRVRVLLYDRARERVDVYGAGAGPQKIDHAAADVRQMFASVGPHSLRFGGGPTDQPQGALADSLAGCRSAVVLPLAIGDRTRGVVLLLFESATPAPVNLDLHATMAVQVTAAIENAWLYRSAVEDLHTGAYRPEFFAGQVAQAIGEAGPNDTVALLGFRIVEGEAFAKELGVERHGRLLEGVLTIVRRVLGSEVVACRAGDAEIRAMLRDVADREVLEARCAEIATRVAEEVMSQTSRHPPLRVTHAFAVYPTDAASAEFLSDALTAQLRGEGGPVRGLPMPAGVLEPAGAGVFVDSPSMQSVFRTLERVAPTNISVLLEGETGVGKEVLTNLLHAWSKRASGPLVKVHCAALPESLLQSELFGHEKGAFTGAHARSVGRFEQADGGTIFLDEIGEISLDVQVQLLRVLQEREIQRVGGSESIPVDVRIVAATNRNMRDMVAAGAFREDLYYRLQGMVVVVPPLRDRKPEIPQLVEFFRQEAVDSGQTQVVGFAPDAMDELFRRDWPGNIRELRNAVFRAMVFARGELVTAADFAGGFAGPLAGGDAGGAKFQVGPQHGSQGSPSSGSPAAGAAVGAGGESRAGTAKSPRADDSAPRERVAEKPATGAPAAGAPAPRPEPPTVLVPQPPRTKESGPGSGPASAAPEVPDGPLSGRLEALRDFVARRGEVSSADYAAFGGLSARTALRDLQRLQELGVLSRSGRRRGARYRLSEVANNSDTGLAN